MIEVDQRVYPRYDVSYPVTIETPQGIVYAETKNMSTGGAFICCERSYEPESIVQLAIELPTGSPLHLTAKVIWLADCDNKMRPSGMGVYFEL